jgi:TolB protein
MTSRFLPLAGVATLSLASLTACSMQYNGAWGFDNTGSSKAPATAKATGSTRSPTAAHTAVGPAAAPMQTAGSTDATNAQAMLVSQPAGEASSRAGRPMNVFGEMPGVVPSKSSPLDGTDNLRQVTFAAEGADFDPSLDPTGQWLVYASTQHRETADLYIKRVDGRTLTQLTNDPGDDAMPAFSPDGTKIAYASNRAGNWDIYLMDAKGGQSVQLTSEATHDIHPSFSPDGRQLVYSTYGSQSGQWELVVIDLENPARKRFIGYGLFPEWSPVDNRILFQRARERGTRWFSIWTIDMVNGEGMRPTEIAASANAALITPKWSPDGKHVVFCTVVDPSADATQRPDASDIWVVDVDGKSRSRLTRSQFRSLQPVWSPDGTIYFVGNRSQHGTENVWAIRPESAIQLAAGLQQPLIMEAEKPMDAVPTERTVEVPTTP